jgi:hypothetical protein
MYISRALLQEVRHMLDHSARPDSTEYPQESDLGYSLSIATFSNHVRRKIRLCVSYFTTAGGTAVCDLWIDL